MCSRSTTTTKTLPVIIVGAGPCGLVTALVLRNHNVPFVIIEKASRAKICSNAGSGFELARTAIEILKDRLELPTEEIMMEYAGMYGSTMQGKLVRDQSFVGSSMRLASVNRAQMQAFLLKKLFPTPESEVGALKCGAGFQSYVEDTVKGQVTVTLTDQSTVMGSALLGCDGINSKVRKSMQGGDELDPLRFCNCICYWGKCPMPKGSDLEKEMDKTQTCKDDGPSFAFGLSVPNAPGSSFLVPTNGYLVWAFFFHSKEPPKTSDDMTRRGGRVLDETAKRTLEKYLEDHKMSSLMRTALKHTEPSDITEAGLFDRQILDLPYSSPGKLVTLLGDAAHPQTPFLGQGVNMAIADAYVVATRISLLKSLHDVPKAISQYDTTQRREESKSVVRQAYFFAQMSISSNPIVCWLFCFLLRLVSASSFVGQVDQFDKSNRLMVKQLDADMKNWMAELRLDRR